MRTLWVTLAWVLGVYLGFELHTSGVALLAALSITILLGLAFRKHPRLLVCFVCAATLFSGALRVHYELDSSKNDNLEQYNTSQVSLRGVVVSDPEPRGNLARFRLAAKQVKTKDGWQPVTGQVLITAGPSPQIVKLRQGILFRYGDELEISGKLSEPKSSEEFDYRDYLAKQSIHSLMFMPTTKLLGTGEASAPMERVYSIRRHFATSISRVVPEPQASVGQAFLLGIPGGIPDDLSDAFNRSGTTHLLSVSGMHVSVVLGMAIGLAKLIGRKRRAETLLLPLTMVWAYGLLAGMAPPIQRAALMGTFYLVGTYFGRQRSGALALGLAAALIVGLDPASLWQVSFQLSFLAMAGLVFLSPAIDAVGRYWLSRLLGSDNPWRPLAWWTIASIAVSAGAVIATIPLVAFYFHRFSLVSIPATMVALPAMPLALATCSVAALVGPAWQPLGQVIGWLAWLPLAYTTWVVRFFAAVPLAAIDTGSFGSFFLWAYYATLTLVMAGLYCARNFFENLKTGLGRLESPFTPLRSRADWAVLVVGGLAALVWVAAASVPDNNLHVTFLDVGQGDATLVQTPSGHNILIDGGPDPVPLLEELGKRLPSWNRRIDLVVLSHPHSDHVGGLPAVLERYQVKTVLQGDTPHSSPILDEWNQRLADLGTKVKIAEAGQMFAAGSATLEVLNPPQPRLAGTRSDVDNNSVVVRLSYGKTSFLSTGDTWSEGEDLLLRTGTPLASTVLKVAHHGSQTSTTKAFVKAVGPRVAVISAGLNNREGHPHKATIATLCETVTDNSILRTMWRGSIEFITNGDRLWVKTDKEAEFDHPGSEC